MIHDHNQMDNYDHMQGTPMSVHDHPSNNMKHPHGNHKLRSTTPGHWQVNSDGGKIQHMGTMHR